MTTKNKLIVFLILLFLVSPLIIFAFEISYPRIPGATAPQDFLGSVDQEDIIFYYTKYIFTLIIWSVGFIAVLILIIGGLRYLFSTGNPERVIGAREQISGAIIGLLILFSSYLILSSISPLFLSLKIPEPIEITYTPSPETIEYSYGDLRSLIATEIPFGAIIRHNIFENTTSESRMERIRRIALNIFEISRELRENATTLRQLTGRCSCSQATPVITGRCLTRDCRSCENNICTLLCEPCTCDPCRNQRSQIERTKQRNLDLTRDLIEEQRKATEEIRLIREEIAKLELSEKIMTECPLSVLESIASFLTFKDESSQWGWEIFRIPTFENITWMEDWATFYCRTSGTQKELSLFQSIFSPDLYPFFSVESTDPEPINEEEIMREIERAAEENLGDWSEFEISHEEIKSCVQEIPVGEILDRAKRIGYKISERLEVLINLGEEIISATNEMHILESQCTSQQTRPGESHGCCSMCICLARYYGKCWICSRTCIGRPCPSSKISRKENEIIDIFEGVPRGLIMGNKDKEGIRDVIFGYQKNNLEIKEQIGVVTIIDGAVVGLLEDLYEKITKPMRTCVSRPQDIGVEDLDMFLMKSCPATINSLSPEGKILRDCCIEETWFNDCLYSCYLEGVEREGRTSYENYKRCLRNCQREAAEAMGTEAISDCPHTINFFCCSMHI